MRRKIYKLGSSAKQGLLVLAFTVFSAAGNSQTTYTFNYTGGQQTMALQAGTYSIETWGANGGTNLGNGGSTYPQNGGKGGYSIGIYSLTSPSTVYVNAGGLGGASTTTLNVTVPGGYNGGGYGSANTISGKSSGAGGGGASHVATSSGTLGALSSNTPAVLIVAGGGGGAGECNYVNTNTTYNSNGGNGGGLSGLQNPSSSYQGRQGQGGTQTAGGGGGDNASATAGVPLQGIFGAGGYNPTAGTNSSAGGSGAGGGGGGWYGGGAGWVSSGSAYQSGSGGGGSGYVGGVSSGTTFAFGTSGYISNPDLAGNGRVHITELCSVIIYASGSNSLNPSICSGQSLTLTTNAVSNFSWSTGQTTSSIVVAPSTNTVYSLVATSSLNCSTSSIRNVIVSSGSPAISISNPSNTICFGQTVTLTASGAVTYTWANPGVVNGQSFTPSSSAIYTVNGQNGCGISSATTAIAVAPILISISATSTLVCEGTTATLTAASSVPNYTWYPNNFTGSTAIVAPTSSMVYTVFGTDGICSGTNTFAINTKPNPTISIVSTASAICPGQSVYITATGANTYTWMPGNVNGNMINVSPSTSTVYVVTGGNTVGCTSIQQQPVIVNSAPVININANATILCSGNTVTMTASGGSAYVWNGGPSTAVYVATVNATMVYTVTGSQTSNTCTTEKTVSITAIVPNLTLPTNTSVCAGKSVTVFASGANTYNWNSIPTGSLGMFSIQPTQSQTVTLIATTTSLSVSCPVTHTFVITVNPLPTLTVTPARATICKNESNTLTVSGAQNYTWTGGTSSNTLLIKPTTGQTFTVLGVNANGCDNTASYQAIVNSCTGLSELSKGLTGVLVYPNPSEGNFSIQSERPMELLLTNALGQKVGIIRLTVENNYKYEVKDLPAGIYFATDQNGSSQDAIKIIVH